LRLPSFINPSKLVKSSQGYENIRPNYFVICRFLLYLFRVWEAPSNRLRLYQNHHPFIGQLFCLDFANNRLDLKSNIKEFMMNKLV